MNHMAFPTVLCVILYFSTLIKGETKWPSNIMIENFGCKSFIFMNEKCNGLKPFDLYEYEEDFFTKPQDETNNFYAGADGSMCSQSGRIFVAKGTELEVKFSAKKYEVGDAFEVGFVDVDIEPEEFVEHERTDIQVAIDWKTIHVVMSSSKYVKVIEVCILWCGVLLWLCCIRVFVYAHACVVYFFLFCFKNSFKGVF